MPLSLSTLADQVGACTAVLMPLFKRLQAHVLAAERLHGDDTTVPVLARGKTDIARLWIYVRDDRPFGGPAPPGAVFYYSRDRGGEHPQAIWRDTAGILQADAYGGYGKLYEPGRTPGPDPGSGLLGPCPAKVLRAGRLARAARARRTGQKPGGDLADLRWKPSSASTPCSTSSATSTAIAPEGAPTPGRRSARRWWPICTAWLREQRAKLSRGNDVAKAIDYMLKRWTAFTRFLDDGRICLSNNAAERGAARHRSWVGSRGCSAAPTAAASAPR